MSYATVSASVRPEFQLKVAIVDFVSQTGIEVKAGTIFARMYYAPGCELSGQRIKSAIKLSDRINRGHRTIEFICTNIADYRTLYNSCGRSNIAVNRMRTVELLNKCFAAPATVRPFQPEVISNPWDTHTKPVCLPAPLAPINYQLCLPAAEEDSYESLFKQAEAFAHKVDLVPDYSYDEYNFISVDDDTPSYLKETIVCDSEAMREVLEVKTVKQLRYIAKVYGITLGKQNKEQLVTVITKQLVRRNVNPVQLRTLPTAK